MDVGEKFVKVDLGMELKGVEGEEIVEVGVGSERELEVTRNKCKELEGRSKKAEDKCMALELEIEKRKSEFELLQGKISVLEVKKNGFEDEIKVLRGRNAELERQITLFENENKAVGGVKGTQIVVDLTEEKDEEDKVIQLMIENKVLECEKKKAESELEVWKLKCGELESQVLELEKENLILRGRQSPVAGMVKTQLEMHKKQTTDVSNLKGGLSAVTSSEHLETKSKMVDKNENIHFATGMSSTSSPPLKGIEDLQLQGTACTPLTDIPSMHSTHVEGRKRCFIFETESRVRRQLAFGEEGILSTKMAPSTPGGAKQPPFGLVDISDSEDELANTNVNMPHFKSQVNGGVCVSTIFSSGDTVGNESNKTSDDYLKRTLFDQSDGEDMSSYNGTFPVVSTPKRKRASNIVTTDSESDDDNVPICKLRTKHLRELNDDAVAVTATVSKEKVHESAATPRRRLVTLRKCNVKNVPEGNSPCNSNDSGTNYYSRIPTNEGVEDDVPESDTEGESLGGFIVKSSGVSDSDDDSSASEDVSDENVDFGEVLSTIRRQGNSKLKWDFEADMLAAFGKDLALCMKAVCALYRQQTSEEKFSKGTLYSNRRGFSQCDAFRGTNLAEFLTDGDPKGDLNKSVEELQEYDPKGPELCRTLATHYSKQLFAIYKNKEDPLFLPP